MKIQAKEKIAEISQKSTEDTTNPFENEDFSDDDRTFDPKKDADESDSNSEVDENFMRGEPEKRPSLKRNLGRVYFKLIKFCMI